ncbi:MAG: hypothetical protein AAGA58_01765 [Verrucomicrobiota bacterium]
MKILVVGVLLALLGMAHGQGRRIVLPPTSGGQVDLNALLNQQQAAQAAGNNAAVPTKPANTLDPEAERLNQFMKLTFNRLPSNILAAWSTTFEAQEAELQKAKEEAEKKANEAKEKVEAEKKAAEEKKKKQEEEKPKEELTEEQKKAAAKKKEDEKKKAEAAEKKKKEAEEKKKLAEDVAREMRQFQRWVTLGEWERVGGYFEKFKEADRMKAYGFFLGKIAIHPNQQRGNNNNNNNNPNQRFQEQQTILPLDILGIADASPEELEDAQVAQLARLLRSALGGGTFADDFLEKLEKGTKRLGGKDEKNRLLAARLLIDSGRIKEAGTFLPDVEKATEDENVEGLLLLARFHELQPDEEERKESVRLAWDVTQTLLGLEELEKKDRETSIVRAVTLIDALPEGVGVQWLKDEFTKRPELGREILAAIGNRTVRGRAMQDGQMRQQSLKLQDDAVRILSENAPSRAEEWSDVLALLAMNWLHEAEYSRENDNEDQSQRMTQRYDNFGNLYFVDPYEYQRNNWQYRSGYPRPIPTSELLDVAPGDKWKATLPPSVRPRFTMVMAQLFLKVQNEDKALPFIEKLAASYPEKALELANESVRVWAKNHDPNANRRYTNPYMYIWGYNRQSEAIPLTRSKQVRNLKDLAEWLERLKKLSIGDLDETAVVNAFTTTHSSAEVYRAKDIELVFGSFAKLSPEMQAELVQKMRQNLITIWRNPKVQQDKKTKRRDKEIEAEVQRGYEVAMSMAGEAVQANPDSWQLALALAATEYDALVYAHELSPSSEFKERQSRGLARFAKAAQLYVNGAPEREEHEESSQVFDQWFYASLGASDLGAIRHTQVPVTAELPKLREAILSLPDRAAERHMGRFANSLSTRMSSVKAELKHRYLKSGLEIAGGDKQARQAQKVFDYYNDLVTEIRLETRLDGSDKVGHEAPFGVFVDLTHTKHIERESGGFSKYLTNQNNSPYAWNYGRPKEDYRDKFEEAARATLEEHFLVHSVTFHDAKIKSRGTGKPDWRVTPYAYILLQAKGSEVDMLPPLQMDLDFLDSSGYVILPISSAKIPLDGNPDETLQRPFADLEVTQTFNEDDMQLEVRATAKGLVPAFENLLDFDPEGFEVAETDAQPLGIIEMDSEGDIPAAISERTWVLKLAQKEEATAEALAKFEFGEPKVETKGSIFQTYEDVDLVESGPVLRLAGMGAPVIGKSMWPWLISGAALLVILLGIFMFWPRGDRETAEERYAVPSELTPFTAVSLLRRMEQDADFPEKHLAGLREEAGAIEAAYFDSGSEPSSSGIDLESTLQKWIKRAPRGT